MNRYQIALTMLLVDWWHARGLNDWFGGGWAGGVAFVGVALLFYSVIEALAWVGRQVIAEARRWKRTNAVREVRES